ncbi:MAG: SUMF1/EgtB/PvdO family nonheme iron enzyme [Rhizonema sp. PD37]|nr:SUMF1/EgtB/PvdO family nonheme iron enzyme [Rhizonema sp. PD37]
MVSDWKSISNLVDSMVLIPGGTFKMGSTLAEVEKCVTFWSKRLCESSFTEDYFRQWIMKEYPSHTVRVSPFWIGRYPITNRQYLCFTQANKYSLAESLKRNEHAEHPVWGVSLTDVKAFIDWLNNFTEGSYRLPTEAEWEYAARGSSDWEYPFGSHFDTKCCNTLESSIGGTTPVYQYADYASTFGICDLAGNVEEWTADYYTPYLGGKFIIDDLVYYLGSHYPITRGGSFARSGDLARCARRHGPHPGSVYKYMGFRLAADYKV